MGSESVHCLLPPSASGFSTGIQREQARSLGSGSSEFKPQGSAPEERRPPWCPFSLTCCGYSIHSAVRLGSYKHLGRKHHGRPKGTGLTRLDMAVLQAALGPGGHLRNGVRLSRRQQAYLWFVRPPVPHIAHFTLGTPNSPERWYREGPPLRETGSSVATSLVPQRQRWLLQSTPTLPAGAPRHTGVQNLHELLALDTKSDAMHVCAKLLQLYPTGKEPACQCRIHKRRWFNPWVGKISLEESMATHSSVLAWRIPWAEKPGRLQSIGLRKSQT